MADVTVLKALVLAGCGSRRAMAEAIKQGRIAVNGVPVASFKQEIEGERDVLTLDGKLVTVRQEECVYFMLNKPVGVLSTTHDERGRKTVIDFLPPKYKNLNPHPVGRLDMDSSGLLLLTDDGALTYRLTHPSFEKEKEYVVTLDRELSREDKARFEHGIELEDGLTWPTTVRESPTEHKAYYVILHEGRKRQLRRMFTCLGYRVSSLKRIRMGTLLLGDLPEGKMRVLSQAEVAMLNASKTLA
ncbi:MAG: pseudouridine synthase [Dehalococcoidales bacterium]|jgi:23S rRNA pseudouridine2605 synthase